MEIRFAESRPSGDFALVLPIAGKDRSSLGSLGASQQPSPPHSIASVSRRGLGISEQFIDENGTVRRAPDGRRW